MHTSEFWDLLISYRHSSRSEPTQTETHLAGFHTSQLSNIAIFRLALCKVSQRSEWSIAELVKYITWDIVSDFAGNSSFLELQHSNVSSQ